MMAGVALHLHGATVPGAEILVALTVLALGSVMILRRSMSTGGALALFAGVGIIHGYALGESIYGAEPTPLYAYLTGLAVIQGTIALAAAHLTRLLAHRSPDLSPLRLVGAGIVGIGLAVFMQQVIPGA
jgi:urease accessory protein